MTGRINLFHEEKIVRTNLFNCDAHREQIIDNWRKLYGKGFERTIVETVYDKGVKQLRKELPEEEVAFKPSNFKKGSMPKKYKLSFRNKPTGKIRFS